MDRLLEEARLLIEREPKLAGYDIHAVGKELHLAKGDEVFTRLIPTDRPDRWRMEYFQNRKRWEHIDFTGSLHECLEFLASSPHYLFWEG